MKNLKNRAILIFALASFLNDFGSDIIYPLWPLYVTEVLGASMIALGFLDGLGNALVSISQGLSGYLSDKIRRRKLFIWSGYLMGAISRVGYSTASSWQWLIPYRALDRAGKIRGAPRDAMIADLSSKQQIGRNFGFLRMMDHLGAFLGVIAGVLLVGILGYRKLFFLAAFPSLLSLLLIVLFISEQRKGINRRIKISFKDFDKNFYFLLLSISFFALGNFSYSFLLLAARGENFKTSSIPLLYLVFTFTASIMSLPMGRISDKFGKKAVLLWSFLLFMILCLGFIFVGDGKLLILLLFIIYGFHLAAFEPSVRALASKISSEKIRATALGTLQMGMGLLSLPASLIAGFLWQTFGKEYVFIFSLITTFVAIAGLAFVKE
ncbi:MAG: MFS transporter [Candidatus Schekmanbacteria bacterium]|nr:MAG: MFS transporter [Candidatus Schekmanbacteria bacterium]